MQHLLTTDAVSWSVLSCIRLTEEDTTSSSRIFIKILFQDLSENLGLMSLNQRLQEPTLQMFFDGIFPKVRQCSVTVVCGDCSSVPSGSDTPLPAFDGDDNLVMLVSCFHVSIAALGNS